MATQEIQDLVLSRLFGSRDAGGEPIHDLRSVRGKAGAAASGRGPYEITPISVAKIDDVQMRLQFPDMAHEHHTRQGGRASAGVHARNSYLRDSRGRLLEAAGAAVAVVAFVGYAATWLSNSPVSSDVLAVTGLIAFILYVLLAVLVKNKPS